jgi:hypothetical protein
MRTKYEIIAAIVVGTAASWNYSILASTKSRNRKVKPLSIGE